MADDWKLQEVYGLLERMTKDELFSVITKANLYLKNFKRETVSLIKIGDIVKVTKDGRLLFKGKIKQKMVKNYKIEVIETDSRWAVGTTVRVPPIMIELL
jgi:hypothetical protein